MTNPLYLGIDVGTTALKAAVFDGKTSALLAYESVRLKTRTGADGLREQSVAALLRGMFDAARSLRSQLGRRWNDIAGIGLAAQGGSACLCDVASGRPHTPMQLWNDMRFLPYLQEVTRGRTAGYWQRRLLRDEPGHGLGRMLWFREHYPELLQDGNICAGAGELCFHQLTGCWRQDAGSAHQQGAYHAVKQELDQDLLDLVGLPLSLVAPLRRGHEAVPLTPAAAAQLRLPSALPVVGPYMDHEAGFMSVLGRSRQPMQCSLGTAWVANFTMPAKAAWQSPAQIVLPSLTDDNWLVVQPLRAGNVAWDWALDNFLSADRQQALTRARQLFSRRLLPASGSVGVPWFYVANPLFPERVGGGALLGLSALSDGEELVRMIALSLVCEMFRVCRQLKDRGIIDSLVLGGGAAKGAHFRRLFAALFQPLPVFATDSGHVAGPRGVLYPLAPAIAAGSASLVRPPAVSVVASVMKAYDEYLTVFNHFGVDVPGNGPITIAS